MIKLTNLLKEIRIIEPRRSILWGMDNRGRFTELVKLKGFKTPQEALDKINQAFPDKNPYELFEPFSDKNNPSYAYLSGDGSVSFVQDLSEFDTESGYDTEEGWGVDEWSNQPPS